MKNFKNNFKKHRYRGNGDKSYKRNGTGQSFEGNYSVITEFRRNKPSRNNNASRLIEKYTTLAKEALSNGDKILSENYFQHADHFIRISEQKNLDKDLKKNNETNIPHTNEQEIKDINSENS